MENKEEERVLLYQLQEGDRVAFTKLYRYYQPRLYLFLGPFMQRDRQAMEEIVQEVFIKVWLKRTELGHVRIFEAYLQRMAKNLLLDTIKLRQIKLKHENLSAGAQKNWVAETEDQYHFKEYQRLTIEALQLLPQRRRYLFQLSTLEGHSLDEICFITHLSKAVVKKQLALANQFLRSYLLQKGGIPIQAGLLLIYYLFEKI